MAKGLALFHHAHPSRGVKFDGLTSLLKRAVNRVSRYYAERHEREIARYIQEHGGVLTDDVERQISSRYCGTSPRGWL